MSKMEVGVTIAVTLICAWLADMFGQGQAAWIAGYLGLAILVIVSLRIRDGYRESNLAPSLKEFNATQKLGIERQTAALILEREQADAKQRGREEKIQAYVREIENLIPNSPMGLQSVQPGPGDDPQLVQEAWSRHVNRKIAMHGPASAKWRNGRFSR
jgi:hypothetical protein